MTSPTAPTYAFQVPVKTESTSNLREHPMARYRRTDAQKRAARRRCPEWAAGPLLVVRLTRVSPRKLDDDNVRGALKSIRDAVATWLRVDDASPLVRWEYVQEKGTSPAVRVEVFLQGPAPTPVPLTPVLADAGGPRVVREPGDDELRRGEGRTLAELATPNTLTPRRR